MGQHRPPPDWASRDEQELERLYAGEDEALAEHALCELQRRHHDRLEAQARKQCGGKLNQVEDATQELESRLREKRRKYQPEEGHWLPWARTVLHNIITDEFRLENRFRGVPVSSTAAGDPMDTVADDKGSSPDTSLRLAELTEAMNECLQGLSPEEREALNLQVQEGLSLEEIGQRTGVTLQGAGTRVYRAKQKLRACLKSKGYERGEV